MASCSSTAPIKWKYDVFLSFRGEDTRKSFISHLYKILHQKGIYTFKDDEKLERGKSISPELLKAIKSSRFSIIVFSKNYASSTWCLEELVAILECMDTIGQIVLPIFYKVDPSHVKKQQGAFAKAFAEHEKRFKGSMGTVQKWRDALARIATISGWNSREWEEALLIEQIVKDILKKLAHTISSDGFGLVRIDSRTRCMRSYFCIGLKEVRIIGIWGMGGIGKTTIARAIYDEAAHSFEACCFLENVREESKHNTVHLQKQLLSRILKTKIDDVEDLDSFSLGAFLKRRLQNLRVFIVLDDVDDKKQLESLVSGHNWFGEGSRIIITTRNKEVLEGITDEIHEERGLANHESLMLFSMHAFKQTNPHEGFMDLSHMVINYARGNPLALRVLGSFLYRKTNKEWKCALERLKLIPHVDIFDVLKISLDGLLEEEKDIFLHVACFLKGKDTSTAVEILRSCGYFPELAFTSLVDRCLMDCSFPKLWMHDLIQEMGWEVVRRQSIKEPGKRSRLWLYEDVYHVLSTNTGTKKIEGIALDSHIGKHVCINHSSFSKMHGLRLLIFKNINVFQDSHEGLETLPRALKYIYWEAFPFSCLPPGPYIKNLVVIDMPRSHIKQLWRGTQSPVKLKVLNLSYSQCLTSIPDLSRAANLESLILNDCTSLVEVHRSIGCLRKLKILNMKGCKRLTRIPELSRAAKLECLILSDCTSLVEVSCFVECLRSLKSLNMERCKCLTRVPNLSRAANLETLILSGCTSLVEVHDSVGYLKKLKILNMEGCERLTSIPDLSRAANLESLILSDCTSLVEVHNSIGHLKKLKILNMKGCTELQSLPTCMSLHSLEEFFLSGCKKLKEFPENIYNLKSLRTLEVSRTAITEVPTSIASLTNLRELSLAGCNRMKPWRLDLRLQYLSDLNLSDCNLMDVTSAIGCLSNLRALNLSGNKFRSIPEAIRQLYSLKYLYLARCKELQSLPLLPPNMMEVDAANCTLLGRISQPFHNATTFELDAWNGGRLEFQLSNCPRLAWYTRGSFMLKAMQNFHLMQVKFQERHLSQGLCFLCWPQLVLYFPGNDVPEWFSHRSFGDTVAVNLPLDFLTNRRRGLAVCAIISIRSLQSSGSIFCRCNIQTSSTSANFGHTFTWNLRCIPHEQRDHVLLAYVSCDQLQNQSSLNGNWIPDNDVEGSFSFRSDLAGVEVKSCGVHLIDVIHGSDHSQCFLATNSSGSNAETKRPCDSRSCNNVEVSSRGSYDEEPPAKRPKEKEFELSRFLWHE